jgi:hypothetical protein
MNSMRILKRWVTSATLLSLIALFSGCLSLSVNPLYDDDTIVFLPGLVGVWGDPDGADSETWEFQRSGERGYRMIVRSTDTLRIDKQRDGVFEAQVVRLGDAHFLDLYPEEPEGESDFYKSHIVPAHSFWRLELDGNLLNLDIFETKIIEKAMEDGTLEIDHVEQDGILVFTAPTPAMQELVMRYRDQVFVDRETVQRIQ